MKIPKTFETLSLLALTQIVKALCVIADRLIDNEEPLILEDKT